MQDDKDFLAALKTAKEEYRTDANSKFGILKRSVQESILDAAKKGRKSVAVCVKGHPREVVTDVVNWFTSIGMDAKYYGGDQRDPADEIHVSRF